MNDLFSVKSFRTSQGGLIYQLPLEVFPGFWAYAYLVFVDGYTVLIDTGSGYGNSNDHLEAGFKAASDRHGREISLDSLSHILITHGHIDHFGGLNYVRPRTKARLGVHELDLRILSNYEERRLIASHDMQRFLIEAGVSASRLEKLLELYNLSKGMFHSIPVDFTYEAEGMRLGPFEFLHVPGHCAGHVVIRLHDILFSGDHVLEGISPHQAPERLTLSTGLGHYLQSLEVLRPWAGQVRLTLGGHKKPVRDLPARLDAIRALHNDRLEKVLDYLREAHTIVEVSRYLFGEVHGYNVLLALEEAGAHVEYLYQRGLLGIENLSDLENGSGPGPIWYRRPIKGDRWQGRGDSAATPMSLSPIP
jgi:glyoxylase-like metal-dependent hydrolase (beta-lactamase superfamily II)